MARKQKLKVYRTPIGFHDAYVAAPSQKAALEAWGADVDLFARGVAELVDDEALARDPLAHPGEVIRRSRGSAEEQLAALPVDPPRSPPKNKRKADEAPAALPRKRKAKPPPPRPRPSRAALDEAEQRLEALAATQAAEDEELRRRERELARERRALTQSHDRARRDAERAVEREREEHAAALSRWRDGR